MTSIAEHSAQYALLLLQRSSPLDSEAAQRVVLGGVPRPCETALQPRARAGGHRVGRGRRDADAHRRVPDQGVRRHLLRPVQLLRADVDRLAVRILCCVRRFERDRQARRPAGPCLSAQRLWWLPSIVRLWLQMQPSTSDRSYVMMPVDQVVPA